MFVSCFFRIKTFSIINNFNSQYMIILFYKKLNFISFRIFHCIYHCFLYHSVYRYKKEIKFFIFFMKFGLGRNIIYITNKNEHP